MPALDFAYFVTMWPPGEPMQWWNALRREWTTDKNLATRYEREVQANITQGQLIRRRPELQGKLLVDYYSTDHVPSPKGASA